MSTLEEMSKPVDILPTTAQASKPKLLPPRIPGPKMPPKGRLITLLQDVHLPPETFTVPVPTPEPWVPLQPATDTPKQQEDKPLFTVGTNTVSPPAQPMETSPIETNRSTPPSDFMECTGSVFQQQEDKRIPVTSTRRLSA
ncbi:unnamed protein product [Allacma fusca]|uniref:Uncharacterized protein n=1 Tax=Allacma fusca TaxID=39272 RepID=A0A8J2NZ50_9HEXA|nr:unnamed protein product [Allacma fusca]